MPKVRNYNFKETSTERKSKDRKYGTIEDQKLDTQPLYNMKSERDANISDNEENSNMNMPRRVKSGVGANSNLRRKSNDG